MIVVATIGILAAIAVPAFVNYTRMAKTSEATYNLKGIFVTAATYYNLERLNQQGLTASFLTHCTVAGEGPIPSSPGAQKQIFSPSSTGAFVSIGFTVGDPIYYGYTIAPRGGTDTCDNPSATAMYTLTAIGNLDGDSLNSTFELAVGTTSDNDLFRAPGFYITIRSSRRWESSAHIAPRVQLADSPHADQETVLRQGALVRRNAPRFRRDFGGCYRIGLLPLGSERENSNDFGPCDVVSMQWGGSPVHFCDGLRGDTSQ